MVRKRRIKSKKRRKIKRLKKPKRRKENDAKPLQTHHKIKIAALLVVVFLLGIIAGTQLKQVAPQTFTRIEFPVDFPDKDSYTQVIPSINSNILSLSSECHILSFGITQDQAFSIYRGIGGIIDTRPLTHDTIKDMLDNFGIGVLSTRIDNSRDGIYTARLLMKYGKQVLDLDLRPSDATAISVRYGTPMYVRTDILEADGLYVC